MKILKPLLACAALISFAATGLAQGVTAGEKVKESGLIIGRSGEDLTVKTNDMGNITVVLTDDTKVEHRSHSRQQRRDYAASGNSIRLNVGDDTPINFSASSIV